MVLGGGAVEFFRVGVDEIVGVDFREVGVEVCGERGGYLLALGDLAHVALEAVAGTRIIHRFSPRPEKKPAWQAGRLPGTVLL